MVQMNLSDFVPPKEVGIIQGVLCSKFDTIIFTSDPLLLFFHIFQKHL